ncbi:MAG: flagellar basal body P-ring formation chaperone FlgA [Alphaproteobacteria bacterium]
MNRLLLFFAIIFSFTQLKAEGEYFKLEDLNEVLQAEVLLKLEEINPTQKGVPNINNQFKLSQLRFSYKGKSNLVPFKILEENASNTNKTFQLKDIAYNEKKGEFVAEMLDSENKEITLKGRVVQLVKVPVLAREFKKGEVIREGDIKVADMPKKLVRGDIMLSSDEIIGKSSSRAVREGAMLKAIYFTRPFLVKKNDVITGTYVANNITIQTKLQAMKNAEVGEIIDAKNIDSGKIIKVKINEDGSGSVFSSANNLTASIEKEQSL